MADTINIQPNWGYVAKVVGIALDIGIAQDGKAALKDQCTKMANLADFTGELHRKSAHLIDVLLSQDKVMNALNKETITAIRDLQSALVLSGIVKVRPS